MKPEREKTSIIFTSSLGIILTFEKSLSSHSADRKIEIILRMHQPQMIPQVITV